MVAIGCGVFLFKSTLVFGAILHSQLHSIRRYRTFLYAPCPHTYMVSFIILALYQSGLFVVLMNPYWHHYHTKSIISIRLHSWCCVLYELGKILMTCIHHHSNIPSGFTALTVVCSLPICPFPPSPAAGNCWFFFTVSILLTFLYCHIGEIIQYVAYKNSGTIQYGNIWKTHSMQNGMATWKTVGSFLKN